MLRFKHTDWHSILHCAMRNTRPLRKGEKGRREREREGGERERERGYRLADWNGGANVIVYPGFIMHARCFHIGQSWQRVKLQTVGRAAHRHAKSGFTRTTYAPLRTLSICMELNFTWLSWEGGVRQLHWLSTVPRIQVLVAGWLSAWAQWAGKQWYDDIAGIREGWLQLELIEWWLFKVLVRQLIVTYKYWVPCRVVRAVMN